MCTSERTDTHAHIGIFGQRTYRRRASNLHRRPKIRTLMVFVRMYSVYCVIMYTTIHAQQIILLLRQGSWDRWGWLKFIQVTRARQIVGLRCWSGGAHSISCVGGKESLSLEVNQIQFVLAVQPNAPAAYELKHIWNNVSTKQLNDQGDVRLYFLMKLATLAWESGWMLYDVSAHQIIFSSNLLMVRMSNSSK